ncbi:MAG: MarR family transcriptional regulator [Moraxellaceae bacterium]|nr:MAG: MarR family transcriptional regulator [Moraxellaceae bacterium]
MKSKAPETLANYEVCLGVSLRKASRVVSRIYDQKLTEVGLKGTQFAILRAIGLLGEANNSLLQSVLVLDQTTLSRNLKPLLRDGYLESHPGEDRRQKVLTLTPEGVKKYHAAFVVWKQAQDLVKAQLGEHVSQQVLDVTQVVIDLHQ